MRQAITTRYMGPTNTKGARIRVKASAGTSYSHWDYALNVDANHAAAARAYAAKLGWQGYWIAGGLPSEDGNVFVCVPADYIAASVRTDMGTVGQDWFFVSEKEA